jgi:hypothetical protein
MYQSQLPFGSQRPQSPPAAAKAKKGKKKQSIAAYSKMQQQCLPFSKQPSLNVNLSASKGTEHPCNCNFSLPPFFIGQLVNE